MKVTRTQMIFIGIIALLLLGALLYYFVFRRRRPAPRPELAPPPADGPDFETEKEVDCDRVDFDPRCTGLFLAVKTCEGLKVDSPDGALDAIMQKINLAPWLNVEVHVIEKRIEGGDIVAILYDRLANTTQEFRIKVAGGAIEKVSSTNKVLGEPVAGVQENATEQFAQFISPLHQDAHCTRREAHGSR